MISYHPRFDALSRGLVSETSMLAIEDVSVRTTILADALAIILCSFTFFEAKIKLIL